jgi:predicted transcriptional regulator
MPYAEDFDAAAAALDVAARTAGTLAQPARTAIGAGVMVGGQLSEVVAGELDAAGAILDEVTTALSELAQTCRERAEVARQALAAQQEYEAAYALYQTDLRQWQDGSDAYAADPAADDPGRPPEPPEPPPAAPPWAER